MGIGNLDHLEGSFKTNLATHQRPRHDAVKAGDLIVVAASCSATSSATRWATSSATRWATSSDTYAM